MIRLVAGIDVGLSSAAASVYGYAKGSNLPALIETTEIRTVGEDAAKRIDVEWLYDWLVWTNADIGYIENATAMPDPNPHPITGKRARMGAGTMARYLRACGAIEATVKLAGLDGVMVMPGVWQKAIGLSAMRKALIPSPGRTEVTDSQKKNCSVLLARELFPDQADTTFKFFHSHNIAEASLIALYGAARCDLVNLKLAA